MVQGPCIDQLTTPKRAAQSTECRLLPLGGATCDPDTHSRAAGELRKASSVVRTSTTSSLSSLRRLVDEVFPALKRVTSVGPEAETQV